MPAEPQDPLCWSVPDKVQHEIDKLKLSPTEKARLRALMRRFAEGSVLPNDHSHLRQGVEELRLDGNHRIFRLYFGRPGDGLILLALHFQSKKRTRDRRAVDLAVKRLQEWGDEESSEED